MQDFIDQISHIPNLQVPSTKFLKDGCIFSTEKEINNESLEFLISEMIETWFTKVEVAMGRPWLMLL